ncbi:MAG: hypothetical protein WC861_01695, partial [Candidatus Micrarchaeia archaeon]
PLETLFSPPEQTLGSKSVYGKGKKGYRKALTRVQTLGGRWFPEDPPDGSPPIGEPGEIPDGSDFLFFFCV